MVSIVVMSLDGPESVEGCLSRIEEFTPEEHRVIVVDVPEVGGDWAVARAMNRAAEEASGDHIAFLTADTEVTPSWLTCLLRCMEKTGAGAVGPMCNLLPGAQNLLPDLCVHSDVRSFAASFNRPDASKWRRTVGIASAPILVSRDLFSELDGFDERFGSGGFLADDFCLRAARRGETVYVAGDTYVHRHGPRHLLQGEPDRMKVMDSEARRMCAKWSLDDPLVAQPRRDVVSMVDVRGKEVLDIKCRAGATLLECVARGASSVTGFEDDRTLRTIAGACCSGLPNATVLASARGLRPKRTYDVVLAVWQLERLPNPMVALHRYKGLLAEDGVLVAVVRNSWSLSRLLPLLLTAPPPTYPRPAWGPSASPDDVLRWFKEAGLVVTAVKTAYAPPLGQEPFLDGFLKLAKKHGFLDDPKREHYSDECWFLAKLPDSGAAD